MTKLKVKKQFTNDDLENKFKEFALKMNDDVTKALTIAFDGGEPSSNSLRKVLARFPASFSFLTTQHALLKDALKQTQRDLRIEESKYFTEVSRDLGVKAKIKDIEMQMSDEYGDILNPLKETVVDLESKVDLAKNMLTVYQTSCNALQSLGKLLASEEDYSRRQV